MMQPKIQENTGPFISNFPDAWFVTTEGGAGPRTPEVPLSPLPPTEDPSLPGAVVLLLGAPEDEGEADESDGL